MNISLGEKWHYCINMETIWRYSMKNGAILAVVLEDHENDRNRLISFIARYAQEHSVKIETVSFGNGLELIRNYSADFDLLFVDIELPGLDGMKVSEKIRDMDPLIPIIITTNMAQYAIKGYEVDALGFIVKPLPYTMFSYYFTKALIKCERNGKEKKNKTIILHSASGSMRNVFISDIMYILKDKNYIVYHLSDHSQIKERGTMKDILPRFENTSIRQCSSGCMVNLRHVRQKVGNDVFVDDVCLTISLPFRKTFTKDLMDYVRGM